jgi:two-component system, cell cycle sensor histidine kinase PleC
MSQTFRPSLLSAAAPDAGSRGRVAAPHARAATFSFLFLFALILIVWATTAYVIAGLRDDAHAAAERRISTQAHVAALHVAQVVQAIATSLQSIDDDLAARERPTAAARARIHAQLGRLKNASDAIQTIGIVGADGHVRVLDSDANPPPTDLSDRPYFAAHRDSRNPDLRFNRPFLSRPGLHISIPVTRRIETADGVFAGLVAARIDPHYFNSFLGLIDASLASLATVDGVLLARQPKVDLMEAPRLPDRSNAAEPTIGRFTSPVDGFDYRMAIVDIPGSQLVVRVGEHVETISAEWQSRAAVPVTRALVATLLIVGFGVFIRRREIEVHAARIAEARIVEAANRARAEAEALSRNKSEFLAQMSHEIRTPLNAILGFSEMLSGDALKLGLAVRYRDYANDINFSAQHLLAVINQILDMAKVEAGKWELDETTFLAADLVESTARLVASRAAAANVAIDTGDVDATLTIKGDERTLRQLLLNLAVNAVKHTGADRRVALHATRAADGGAVFAVSDKGAGMAPEDAARVLNPFETVRDDRTPKRESTGLGLPLARLFAELHGGRLALESALGQGTTVRLVLPKDRVVA